MESDNSINIVSSIELKSEAEFVQGQKVIVKYQGKLFAGYVKQRAYDPDNGIWLYKAAGINSQDTDVITVMSQFFPTQHFVADK